MPPASNLKHLLILAILSGALLQHGWAGRPIILTETEVYAATELIVVANILEAKEVPEDLPFGGSSWHGFGFTKFAEAIVEKEILGTAPKKLLIYGGKLNAGVDFRLEEGRYLVLLEKVAKDAYMAVDWHYSFVPYENGKACWLIERPGKRKWITTDELVRRIRVNKIKSRKAGTKNPETNPTSKSKKNSKLKPESE